MHPICLYSFSFGSAAKSLVFSVQYFGLKQNPKAKLVLQFFSGNSDKVAEACSFIEQNVSIFQIRRTMTIPRFVVLKAIYQDRYRFVDWQ